MPEMAQHVDLKKKNRITKIVFIFSFYHYVMVIARIFAFFKINIYLK